MASHQQSRFRIRWWEFILVPVILGGLFALFYPAVESVRNPQGPYGAMYPAAVPDEINRITSRDGLSIITPRNWDLADDGLGGLRIAARGAPLRRLKSIISIRECSPPPEPHRLERCRKIQFQQHVAYEICEVSRTDSFDDPASSSYDLYFERDGKWWNVNFLVADAITELPDSVRQHINTIRVSSPATE